MIARKLVFWVQVAGLGFLGQTPGAWCATGDARPVPTTDHAASSTAMASDPHQAMAAAAAPRPANPPSEAPVAQREGWDFSQARMIPVQSGGRVKPLDSYAREIMLFITGSRSFQGWEPSALLFSWMTDPQTWEDQPFVQISREDVKKQLGLEVKRGRFTPSEIVRDSYLIQYAEELMRKPEASGMGALKQDPREQELKRLLDRIGTYRKIVSGDAWPIIPTAPPAPWIVLAGDDAQGNPIRSSFAKMVLAYRGGDRAQFETEAANTRQAGESALSPREKASLVSANSVEVLYNRLHPFMTAWVLYLIAALLWSATLVLGNGEGTPAASAGHPALRRAALAVSALAISAHVFGFGLRCYVAGRPPVTNMYESVIWVMLGIQVFAAILFFIHRQAILPVVAHTLAVLGLIAADSAPAVMDPSISPLVPVLRSNYWLTIHVLTITLGYAAFALTLGLGNVMLFQFLKKGGGSSAKIAGLSQLTYRAMQFGVVLLAAGTILGGVWADYSWGRFWGWDPKEVWALIALLTYLIILHARYTGWIAQFGFAVWTVCSFLSVVMAWYGVNFVLGVGLHSYGFSTGGRGWIAAFVLTQLAYVALAAAVRSRRKSAKKKTVAPAAAPA